MNMRVGAFEVVDSKGVHWLEKYNDEGKKTARKKVTMCMEASEGARGSLSSVCVCWWGLLLRQESRPFLTARDAFAFIPPRTTQQMCI